MGRKQKQLVSENFSRGAKLTNNSNRYAHTCNHCGQEFPKGRLETLEAHLRRCPSLPQDERNRISSLMDTAEAPSQQHVPSSGVSDNHNHQALLALADVSEAQLHSVSLHHQPGYQYANDLPNSVIERYGLGDLYTATTMPMPTSIDLAGTDSQTLYQYPEPPNDHDSSMSLNFTDPTNASYYPQVSMHPFATYQTAFESLPDRPSVTQGSQYPAPLATTAFDQQLTVSDAILSSSESPQIDSDHPTTLSTSRSGHPQTSHGMNSIDQQRDNTRRRKRAYSPETNQKVRKVREAGACIRCGRLNRVCSYIKPCKECSERKGDKTWTGGCMKFNKGDDFDEWYKPRLMQHVESEHDKINAQSTKEDNGFSIKFTLFDNLVKAQVKVSQLTSKHQTTEKSNEGIGVLPAVVWSVVSIDELNVTILNYVRTNMRKLLDTVDQYSIRHILDAAWACTQGTKPTEKVQMIKGMNSTGDSHMARVIEIWLAVYLLSSMSLGWKIELFDKDGHNLPETTTTGSFQLLRNQINACVEHIIKQSQKDGVLHKLNITRITQKSNKDLYNLFLGILIVLSAVERYCLWYRLTNGVVPNDFIEKAEILLSIYEYAIRGTSMLPVLLAQVPDSLGRRMIVTPPIDHDVPRDKKDYRVNYSMISPFIDELRFEESELRERRVSIHNDIGAQPNGTEWDGWLWSSIFLMMLER